MRIGYIVSMFPCWSETFIANELVDHAENGMDVLIFSIKKPTEEMIQEQSRRFLHATRYSLHLLNPRLWYGHLRLLISQPTRYVSVFCQLLYSVFTKRAIGLKSLAVFALCPYFVEQARENSIAHLHAHFATYPALMAWLIHQFTHIPFSFTAHAHDIYFNQDILRLVAEEASAIVTISEFNRGFILEKVAHLNPEKITVIHCGLDLSRFSRIHHAPKAVSPESPSCLHIISVGRLTGIKGFQFLIDALRLLDKRHGNFFCTIIGDGPLRGDLQQQIERCGLAAKVKLAGSKKSEEILDAFRHADVFALACATDPTEIHDGIPVVFMEAMASGLPVIGTRLSGIPELVRHMETGLLAEPENAEDLCDVLCLFSSGAVDVQQMCDAAHDIIERQFNIRGCCQQLRALFLSSMPAAK